MFIVISCLFAIMSGMGDDNKELPKSVPLDLARTPLPTVKTVEGKTSQLLMTSQALRGLKVLAQGSAVLPSTNSPTLISTSMVPPTVFKQDVTRAQITSILTSAPVSSQGTSGLTIQRPTQISLSTGSLVTQTTPMGTTYHVPRGPAVVANMAAPRSNVASIRAPIVASSPSGGQSAAFVRPPRTPSPAQGTAWLTNTSNGSQIKGATTVLSSPVRGASVTGKPQLMSRSQSGLQNVSAVRSNTAILHQAITIGGHTLKPGQGALGIQALGSTVTMAQVVPARSQAIVYSTNSAGQMTHSPRLNIANPVQSQRHNTPRPAAQVTTTRLTIPVNVNQAGSRLVAPQATVLPSGARISTVASLQQQPTVIGSIANRIGSAQPNVTLGRLSVAASPAQVSNAAMVGPRTFNLTSLVAVANSPQQRTISAQPAKIITQSSQGNIPTAIVNQRQSTVVSSQAIPVANAYTMPQQSDSQQLPQTASVFIHTPLASVQRRTSPNPTSSTHACTNAAASNVTTYSLAGGTYFYDATGNYSVARTIGQQSTPFAALSQTPQVVKPSPVNTQVHGLVQQTGPQPMRYNPVMILDQSRTQQYSAPEVSQEQAQQTLSSKITSSPRPSILRKRDHDGSPLKAAKNLTPILSSLPQQQPPQPVSPPSRPDSRGNGHSSGGSTTISATSSPGLAEVNEDSIPHVPMNNKENESSKPSSEMSPRKKPRKQQLTGNDLDEHNDDMQFISDNTMKRESREAEESDGAHSDDLRDGAPEARQVPTVRKPASASLLNSYRQNWKATHNHYLRYSDVRPKDERRPSIMDLANQYRVQEKVNGWKVHHLSTQMEDLADQEDCVYSQLSDLLSYTESYEARNFEKDINRINELIKGNLQRIKIINDGMIDAKSQIMKIFDHKIHVTDIINRCASKRNFKKREKS